MSCEALMKSYPWITREFLEVILNRETASPVSIAQFTLQPAIQEGENYSSQLIRVRLSYACDDGEAERPTRCESLIIKASLGQKLVRSRNVFAKEIEIFTKIIPAVQLMFREYGVDCHLGPKCYDSSSIDSYLVLSDLITDNYKNVSRQIGLNSGQLKACLTLLSKWHAGSAKHEKECTLQEHYAQFLQPHVSLNGSKQYRRLFENAVSSCIDIFQDDPSMQLICTKLTHLKPTIFEKCCDAVQRDDDEFNVLTHGDLWSNNIMFDGNGDADRLLFLDFQMCYWGSPVLDVAYLLFTSSAATITACDWDALIEYYMSKLISALQLLDCSAICPSKEQLHHQFSSRAILGAAFSLFSVPMRMMERPPIDAINKFFDVSDEGQKYRREIYSRQSTLEMLRNLLQYFDGKNLLD